jgi:hypothetical protein
MNNLSRDQVDYFLLRCSFSGLRILYICYCAFKTKKAFIISELDKSLAMLGKDYSYGFYVCCVSIGLILSETNDNIINVVEIDENLLEKIEGVVKKQAQDFDAGKSVEELSRYSRVKQIQEVDEYFKIKI